MNKTKVAVITGASSGIGKEFAAQLYRKGWTVWLLARRKELLEKACFELTNSCEGGAFYAVCDVSNKNQIKESIANIIKTHDHIDLLIANAGIGEKVTVENFKTSTIERLYQVNVFGVLNMIESCLPHMLSRKSGQIVAISSLAAYKAFPGMHPYCATKSALNSHLEGLQLELNAHNIFVTTLCPGFIRTAMTQHNKFPMPFLMSKEKAVEKMLNAIFRKKKVYNFPFLLYF